MSPDSLVCLGFFQFDAMSLLFYSIYSGSSLIRQVLSFSFLTASHLAIHVQPYCIRMGGGKEEGYRGTKDEGVGIHCHLRILSILQTCLLCRILSMDLMLILAHCLLFNPRDHES